MCRSSEPLRRACRSSDRFRPGSRLVVARGCAALGPLAIRRVRGLGALAGDLQGARGGLLVRVGPQPVRGATAVRTLHRVVLEAVEPLLVTHVPSVASPGQDRTHDALMSM